MCKFTEMPLWLRHHARTADVTDTSGSSKMSWVRASTKGAEKSQGRESARMTPLVCLHFPRASGRSTLFVKGITSECWLNMASLCHGNLTGAHLPRLCRIPSKLGGISARVQVGFFLSAQLEAHVLESSSTHLQVVWQATVYALCGLTSSHANLNALILWNSVFLGRLRVPQH